MLEKLLALPIEKKIGQLLFIGLPSTELDSETKELLREYSPGGVCLFARNIHEAAQTRHLIENTREILPVEPLLSLDQEGGLVDRLRRITEPMPAPSSLKTPANARTLAEITAEVVRILGFNMNFAPVVDVINELRTNSYNGLYSRAFGKSKSEVVEFAREYLEILQENGCLGCLKHFPGLGASQVDSHEEQPNVYLTREELFEIDLLPYRRLFPTGKVYSVMIAHASFPRFDLQETDNNGKLLPSSLSYNIVTKLLRQELGFNGIAITDDLEMGAIVKNYGIGEACQKAILAGEDMLAICAGPESIREGFNSILDAVKSERISESRIDESLGRIAQIKSLIQPALPFDTERLQTLSDKISQLNKNITEDTQVA
ncbi:MAG TPA: glycoside hydrolase family 3 N-terminal domain-containing protein [Pyrinomonadaceae bacterium]|nr:glycoside hydrolase family 3 N-terminal domain-containing protein [Pyrinomonadaceae bacterium]